MMKVSFRRNPTARLHIPCRHSSIIPNTCSTRARIFAFFLLMVSCHLLIFLPLTFLLMTLSFMPYLRRTRFTPLPIYALSAYNFCPASLSSTSSSVGRESCTKASVSLCLRLFFFTLLRSTTHLPDCP